MIKLEEKHLIGEGFHRKCYIHPFNNRLCIKVGKINTKKERAREHAYYRRLQKRNIQWGSLSRYYGEINTSLGVGDIYELIRDDNDSPSKTLEYYLNNYIPDGTINAIKKMERYLLDQAIVTTTLKPRNIVLQKKSDQVINAIIIDDIGNTEFIPISNISNFFARQKIYRKLKRFKKHLFLHGIAYT